MAVLGLMLVHSESDGTEVSGGISFGPIGFQVGVKIAQNRLKEPRSHSFYTVPMSLRGTVSF